MKHNQHGGTPTSAVTDSSLFAPLLRLLRCHPDTIRNRIATGLLPAFRLKGGQALLMRHADVLALLEPVRP